MHDRVRLVKEAKHVSSIKTLSLPLTHACLAMPAATGWDMPCWPFRYAAAAGLWNPCHPAATAIATLQPAATSPACVLPAQSRLPLRLPLNKSTPCWHALSRHVPRHAHAMQRHAVSCCTMACHAAQCHAMPCHTTPCHVMLHHAMPCHVTHDTFCPCRWLASSATCCPPLSTFWRVLPTGYGAVCGARLQPTSLQRSCVPSWRR